MGSMAWPLVVTNKEEGVYVMYAPSSNLKMEGLKKEYDVK